MNHWRQFKKDFPAQAAMIEVIEVEKADWERQDPKFGFLEVEFELNESDADNDPRFEGERA